MKTFDGFVRILSDSGVVSLRDVKALFESLPTENWPNNEEELAQELVRTGKLTRFQAHALADGKIESLKLGNYVILDKLGEGGMGQVFKARHRKMNRIIALKVLPSSAMKSPEAIRRFQREVEVAAKLVHPNIVIAHDADTDRDVHFLIMEYVEGVDLGKLVKQRGSLDVRDAINYVAQATKGLDFAHRNGVIHRDIKPSNLIVDKSEHLKILDMGLARLEEAKGTEDDRLTENGQIMGTLDFMAPEQALDTRNADARSDIYSLGCTLYFLLTGQVVFPADTTTKKIFAHSQQPIPLLRSLRPEVPKLLESLFQRMLAKNPQERIQSMADLMNELANCMASSPNAPAVGKEYAPTESLKRADIETSSSKVEGIDVTSSGTSELKKKPSGERNNSLPKPRNKFEKWKLIGLVIGVGLFALPAIFGVLSNSRISKVKLNVTPTAPVLGLTTLPYGPDAPPTAVAPFDSQMAKQHQEVWAKFLGVPVEITNSIGMKLMLIPPGQFDMGFSTDQVDRIKEYLVAINDNGSLGHLNSLATEVPQHRVNISRAFYLGKYEVTRAEFESVTQRTPSKNSATVVDAMDESRIPVDSVTFDDVSEFLSRLSTSERLASDAVQYRLPSEAEWEYACRAGTTGLFYFGDDESQADAYIWSGVNSDLKSSPVGKKGSNAFGLHDMLGNVEEWCEDWFDATYYRTSLNENPKGPANGRSKTIRGGSFGYRCWSETTCASRLDRNPAQRGIAQGFRIVLDIPDTKRIESRRSEPRKMDSSVAAHRGNEPPIALAPFDASTAKRHQEAWEKYLEIPHEIINQIGMAFVLIPPGEFLMGSSQEQFEGITKELVSRVEEGDGWSRNRLNAIPSEIPAHRVRITRGFYMSKFEVTQAEYQSVMQENPSHIDFRNSTEAEHCPVYGVPFRDAQEFCNRLSRSNVASKESPVYRLPTEAEWEFACRAGTASVFYFGDDPALIEEYAWMRPYSDWKVHPVGSKRSNAFGLYDMLGNAREWCSDWFDADYYKKSPIDDPTGPAEGTEKVMRGGSTEFLQWHELRSASRAKRDTVTPLNWQNLTGFRIVFEIPKDVESLK